MKSVRYVGITLVLATGGKPGVRAIWNRAKMYDSSARTIAACSVAAIMKAHVQVVFGLYIVNPDRLLAARPRLRSVTYGR